MATHTPYEGTKVSENTDGVRLVSHCDALQSLGDFIASASKSLDFFLEADSLALLSDALKSPSQARGMLSPPTDGIAILKARGIRVRITTQILKHNLPHCTELLKHFELSHSNSLSGNFAISDDNEYLAFFISTDGDGVKKNSALYLSNPQFVSSQLYLCEIARAAAVPARQRISELAKGTEEEFMKTIREPAILRSLISELVTSAIFEISVLFSTKRSFDTAVRESILGELEDAARRGVNVKILVMYDDVTKLDEGVTKEMITTDFSAVRVNFLQQFLPTKITTLIIDQAKSLTIEVKDELAEKLDGSIGISTYSNSESTVFSNNSIFDSLWIQSELDKQNKARQAYFQLFKGFKLKSEVYSRKWSEGIPQNGSETK